MRVKNGCVENCIEAEQKVISLGNLKQNGKNYQEIIQQ